MRPIGKRFDKKYVVATMKHTPSHEFGAMTCRGDAGLYFIPPKTTLNIANKNIILCWVPSHVGAGRSSEVERSLMVRWVVGSILHGVDPLNYFSFQPVLHNWCNKGRGMCYPVCGMVHIKEPFQLIDKTMWRQRVSFLTIRMVLNHMSDAI